MASASIPTKIAWLRAGETLSIAAVGGVTLTWLGFPAGLVTGSLLGVATAALTGRPVSVPVPLSRLISVLVGISLGAVVTPETLKGLATRPVLARVREALFNVLGHLARVRYFGGNSGHPSLLFCRFLFTFILNRLFPGKSFTGHSFFFSFKLLSFYRYPLPSGPNLFHIQSVSADKVICFN